MPRSRSACSVATLASVSSMIALSVISARSADGSAPVSAMIASRRATRPGVKTWRGGGVKGVGRRRTRGVRGGPRGRLPARGAEDPLAERDDEVALLGDRDELARAEQPALGMLPADERLDRGHPA